MRRIRNLGLFFTVTMTIGLLIAFGLLCWQQANQFVEVPRWVNSNTPADFGMDDYQNFSVITEDGLNIHGWYIAPTREDGATFIFLHGHAGHILDLMPEAQLFTGMGYGAVLFDMRGHGSSDDAPVTMGVNEVLDVEAVFNYVIEQETVNPERIALYGNSMGASVAILSAERIPEIRLVIADAPYSSIRDTLVDGIPATTGIPALFFPDVIIAMSTILSDADFYQASPIEAIPNLTQPILLIHGTHDGTIPYHHSEELFASANQPKVLYIVEGGGHTNNYEHDIEGYGSIVLPFIQEYLMG